MSAASYNANTFTVSGSGYIVPSLTASQSSVSATSTQPTAATAYAGYNNTSPTPTTLTLSVSGGLTLSPGSLTCAASSWCSGIRIDSPTTPGTYTGTITGSSSMGGTVPPITVTLTVLALPSTTTVTLNPTAMDYGAQAMDRTSAVKTVTVSNTGGAAAVYNAYTGRLNSIRSGPAANNPTYQNDGYDYDVLGNLESRSQLVANAGGVLSESFTYDGLNRLSTSTIGSTVKMATYDEIGNLTSKTGVGMYRYPPSGAGSAGPNAMKGVEGVVAGLTNPGFSYDENGNLKTGLARSYAWASFNMPSSIDKLDGASAVQRTAFLYNPEHERTRQTISPMSGGVPGAATTTIWYGGGIEKEIDAAANTTTIRTNMPQGLGFIEEKFSGTGIAPSASSARNLRYFLSDHLGSTVVEIDQSQVVLQRMSYDAWGRRRNPDGSDDTGPLWGNLKNGQDHSGYTGHEHLDQLALVNMNARLYDPLLGRHTSADPTIPGLYNGQSFNRYTYVYNNALAFADPTGLGGVTVIGHIDYTNCLGSCVQQLQDGLKDAARGSRAIPRPGGGLTVTPLQAYVFFAGVNLKMVAKAQEIPGSITMLGDFAFLQMAMDAAAAANSTDDADATTAGANGGERGEAADDAHPEAGRKKDKAKEKDDEVKGGHTNGKRSSTKEKHEEGDSRRKRDQERKKDMGFKY